MKMNLILLICCINVAVSNFYLLVLSIECINFNHDLLGLSTFELDDLLKRSAFGFVDILR